MSIAQPLALLGLLLIPVLIAFYMWKAQHQRQVISSTWLWEEALARFSHHPTRRLPLRDPLLLLEILAVIALTALLAGPRITQPARLHQIVVLDGSVAMAATDVAPSRFAAAQHQIEAMIGRLGADDTLTLILAGPSARLVGDTRSNPDLAALVERLEGPSGAADLPAALGLARGAIAAPGAGRPSITFLAAPETPALNLGTLPVRTLRLGGPSLDDRAIATLSARCDTAGTVCQGFARVRNSAAAPRSVDLTILADGQSLGRQVLHLGARGSLDLAFAVPPHTRAIQAELIGGDVIAADDSAWAIVPSPPRLQVLLVSDAPGQMLRALQAVPGLSVQLVGSAKMQEVLFGTEDLLVLDKISPDNMPAVPLLLVNPPLSTSLLNVRTGSAFLPAEQIDVTDPLVQGLDLFGLSTTGERVDVPAWAHVVVGGKNGPLLMDGVQNGVRTAIVTFDVGHSAFSRDLAFPLLVTRIVRYLAPPPPAAISQGAAVWLPSGVVTVRDPAGALLGGPMIVAARQGIYTVAGGTGSRLPGQPIFAVSTANPGDTTPSQPAPNWTPSITAGDFARNLWPLVVVAALLALYGEWWFYARKT